MASSGVNTVAQIAAGAKVIAAISELKCHKMERKPLDHIFIFLGSARGLRLERTEKMEKAF